MDKRLARRERAIRSDAQRGLLLEQGDDLTAPREVDHFARFHSRLARFRFIAWAKLNGYGVASARKAKDDLPKHAVTIVKAHPVDEATLVPITDRLAEKIESLNGVYEGWGCQPAKMNR